MTTLVNNLISNIPVVFANAAGDPVPAPSGGAAPSVSSSAGTVSIGADGSSVDYTPDSSISVSITALFNRDDGTVITVSGSYDVADQGGGTGGDTVAASGSFNDAGITTRPL